MITRVCTGWSPAGRITYGERFLAAFDKHWPVDVELQVYVEERHPMPRNACRSLWVIPGAQEFADRYRANLEANGRHPRQGWKDREITSGYSFKWDAFKFFKQILIPGQAARDLQDGDVLVWLDGDTVTTNPIPPGWVEGLLAGADVVYLNRERQHSEIGFWAVRMGPKVREFLSEIALIYTSDEFLHLREWHSAFVWDTVRQAAGLVERRLCRPGQRGHVWPTTPLARYLVHLKGNRKGRAK